jgi:xyloglucan-specific endo-beta-1,4-glucanase
MDSATSGSQCTTNNGLASDGSLSWSVEWTWQGGPYNVKSYPNVVVSSTPKALSAISSIPAVWDWR